MSAVVFDWIGWVATATFAGSYFCKQPAALRRVQALAALLWIGYGALIRSLPVVVANVVVAVVAVYSSLRPPTPAAVGPPAPSEDAG
jgi:hypothetical protein